MEITAGNLKSFHAWVISRGRSEVTADAYRSHLKLCAAHDDGITARLLSKRLSPNTRRLDLAALYAWALYTVDANLTKLLSEIKLPPPRRMQVKVPLEVDAWRALLRHMLDETSTTHRRADEPLRHAVILMASRGFRGGDVLRMERADLMAARRTGSLSFTAKGNRRLEFGAAPIMRSLDALVTMRDGKWTTIGELVSAGSDRARSNKVRRYLKRHARHANIPDTIYPHQLRRTYATNFLAQMKGDPQAAVKLQSHLQWANVTTALSYTDSVNRDDLDAIGQTMLERLMTP